MPQSFLSELKRRQIYRGGVMYVVAGWVIVQIATQVFPFFDIPVWAIRLVIVVIMLGFPLSLVWLWMFESSLPDATPVDRRQGRDPSGEFAKLMERERSERQKENQDLIAALVQLRSAGAVPAEAGTPGVVAEESPIEMRLRTAPAAFLAPEPVIPTASSFAPPPRQRRVPLLLTLLAILVIVTGVWSLVVPQMPMQASDVPGELTHRYIVPGFYQVEHIAVEWLRPRLHRHHIGIAPEWIFDGAMLLVAWLVLRNLMHSFVDARRRRRNERHHAAAA
jgi:hypothetical protein